MQVEHSFGVQARKDLKPTRKHRVVLYTVIGGIVSISPGGKSKRFDTWEEAPEDVLRIKKQALLWAGIDPTDTEHYDFRVAKYNAIRPVGDYPVQPKRKEKVLWIAN